MKVCSRGFPVIGPTHSKRGLWKASLPEIGSQVVSRSPILSVGVSIAFSSPYLADWDGSAPLVEGDNIAACFQAAVCRHLVSRTHRAMLFCREWAPAVTQLVSAAATLLAFVFSIKS